MLAKDKLPEVVAEVDRLWQSRRDALDPAEARAVLAEVGLPGELLDEALEQIRLREAARDAKRKRLAIAAAVAMSAVIVVAAIWVVRSRSASAHAAIDVAHAHLTDERAPGADVETVHRGDATPLRLAAELGHAPAGEELALACDWVAPSGSIAHHNAWRTKAVDHAPWLTHCRYTLPGGAEIGRWQVRMTLEGRELVTRPVLVE